MVSQRKKPNNLVINH